MAHPSADVMGIALIFIRPLKQEVIWSNDWSQLTGLFHKRDLAPPQEILLKMAMRMAVRDIGGRFMIVPPELRGLVDNHLLTVDLVEFFRDKPTPYYNTNIVRMFVNTSKTEQILDKIDHAAAIMEEAKECTPENLWRFFRCLMLSKNLRRTQDLKRFAKLKNYTYSLGACLLKLFAIETDMVISAVALFGTHDDNFIRCSLVNMDYVCNQLIKAGVRPDVHDHLAISFLCETMDFYADVGGNLIGLVLKEAMKSKHISRAVEKDPQVRQMVQERLTRYK